MAPTFHSPVVTWFLTTPLRNLERTTSPSALATRGPPVWLRLPAAPAWVTVVAAPPLASRRYTCDQPSRSDHQKASRSSLVTYQLTGSAEGGPISTKVLDESRAMTRTSPLFASTAARYALFDARV